jgi:hypothetical protein
MKRGNTLLHETLDEHEKLIDRDGGLDQGPMLSSEAVALATNQ